MQAELATHDKRLDIHGEFMIDAIDAMKKFPMTSGLRDLCPGAAGDGAGSV